MTETLDRRATRPDAAYPAAAHGGQAEPHQPLGTLAGSPTRAGGNLRAAQYLTVFAALLPTLLSAQGMVGVGTDVLRLSAPVAFSLAAFLEMALVASALMARSATLAGYSARADTLATWVFSGVSGLFSASHEVIRVHGDTTTVQLDARAALAAVVRIAAPLVAAWLWDRILVADRQQIERMRDRSTIRRDHLMLSVALAAQDVARARGTRATQVAKRRLLKRHRKLLWSLPAPTPETRAELHNWLTSVGDVDNLVWSVASREPGDDRLDPSSSFMDVPPAAGPPVLDDYGVATPGAYADQRPQHGMLDDFFREPDTAAWEDELRTEGQPAEEDDPRFWSA